MLNVLAISVYQVLVAVGLILVCRKRRRLFYGGMAVLAISVLVEGGWLCWQLHLHRFEVTERAGTVVVVRHGRETGTFGIDVAPEYLVGSWIWPWLDSLGTYGGYDYEWGLEREPAAKLIWEDNGRCWIERFGDGANSRGLYVKMGDDAKWHISYVHKKPNERV